MPWATAAFAATVAFPPDLTSVLQTASRGGIVYVAGVRAGTQGYLALVDRANGIVVDLSRGLPDSATPWALSVDNSGWVYVAGAARGFAFAQKFDRDGRPQYTISVQQETARASRAISIVANEAGEALISGEVTYPNSIGSSVLTHTGFVVKVDAGGRALMSLRGVGAGPATWDRNGNIYVAGIDATLPITAGAFQPAHDFRSCGGTGFVGFSCSYPQVVKLSPDGQRVLYSTFLTGGYGAQPSGLVVNDRGELTIAGTTNSPDYPTTRGTIQPDYRASHPPPPSTGPHPGVFPPAATGFITRLNADGSGLVWSTFFSGSEVDSITDLEIFPDGRIVIGGQAGSPDLPGLTNYPSGCKPWAGREQGFISVLSPAAETLLSTLVTWSSGRLLVTDETSPRFAIVSAKGYREYDSLADQRDVCVAEPADWTFAEETAPGRLLTIFGNGLENAPVDFNGIPVKILFASAGQVNIQTPLDLPAGETATLRIGAAHRTIELPFRVVDRTPRVYMGSLPFDLSKRGAACQGNSLPGSYQAEAYNADGTRNACATPATRGSTVELTVNGLGLGRPDVMIENLSTARVDSVVYDPAYLKWKVRIRVWPEIRENGTDPYIALTPIVNGKKVPYAPLVIWTAPAP